ncbi:hypothetical protein [Bacillus sp. ISL-57]|uniref:hypothetical protein n=1 Tax=Bacillus sp. ISL-57 TaxID=2819135 RepID=UPI001BEC86C2|nr:hypothetical protein [Bacillus sp. ISL-57]MBT2714753.1 hypothetical protein [Bacillus sp. ISL-57]
MGFWRQVIKPRIQVSVLAGGHVLTDGVEGNKSVNRMTIMKWGQQGEVKVTTAFGQKYFKLSRIEWEHNESRNVGKSKNSTILSTALVGSVGAITDIAVRAMKKETSNAYIYLFDEEGEEHKTLIQCTKEQFTEISRLIN